MMHTISEKKIVQTLNNLFTNGPYICLKILNFILLENFLDY